MTRSSSPYRPSVKLVISLSILTLVAAAYCTVFFVLQSFATSSLRSSVSILARETILNTADGIQRPLDKASQASQFVSNVTKLDQVRFPLRDNLSTRIISSALLIGLLAAGGYNEGQTSILCRYSDASSSFGSQVDLSQTTAPFTRVGLTESYEAFATGFYTGKNSGADVPKNVVYNEYNLTDLVPRPSNLAPLVGPSNAVFRTFVNGEFWNSSRFRNAYVQPGFRTASVANGVQFGSIYYPTPWMAFDDVSGVLQPHAFCSIFIRMTSFSAFLRSALVGGDASRSYLVDQSDRVMAYSHGDPFWVTDNYTRDTGGRIYPGCLPFGIALACLYNISDWPEYKLLNRVFNVFLPLKNNFNINNNNQSTGNNISITTKFLVPGQVYSTFLIQNTEDDSYVTSEDLGSANDPSLFFKSTRDTYSAHLIQPALHYPLYSFRLYFFIPLDFYVSDVHKAAIFAVSLSGALCFVSVTIAILMLSKIFVGVEKLAEEMGTDPWEATKKKVDKENLLARKVLRHLERKNNMLKNSEEHKSTEKSDEKKKQSQNNNDQAGNEEEEDNNNNNNSVRDCMFSCSSSFHEVVSLEHQFVSFRRIIDEMRSFMHSTLPTKSATANSTRNKTIENGGAQHDFDHDHRDDEDDGDDTNVIGSEIDQENKNNSTIANEVVAKSAAKVDGDDDGASTLEVSGAAASNSSKSKKVVKFRESRDENNSSGTAIGSGGGALCAQINSSSSPTAATISKRRLLVKQKNGASRSGAPFSPTTSQHPSTIPNAASYLATLFPKDGTTSSAKHATSEDFRQHLFCYIHVEFSCVVVTRDMLVMLKILKKDELKPEEPRSSNDYDAYDSFDTSNIMQEPSINKNNNTNNNRRIVGNDEAKSTSVENAMDDEELIDFRKRISHFVSTLTAQSGMTIIEFFGDAVFGCFRIRTVFARSRLITNFVELLFLLQSKDFTIQLEKEKHRIDFERKIRGNDSRGSLPLPNYRSSITTEASKNSSLNTAAAVFPAGKTERVTRNYFLSNNNTSELNTPITNFESSKTESVASGVTPDSLLLTSAELASSSAVSPSILFRAIRVDCGLSVGSTRVLNFFKQQKSDKHHQSSDSTTSSTSGAESILYVDLQATSHVENDDTINSNNNNNKKNKNKKGKSGKATTMATNNTLPLRALTFLCDEIGDARQMCNEGRECAEMPSPTTSKIDFKGKLEAKPMVCVESDAKNKMLVVKNEEQPERNETTKAENNNDNDDDDDNNNRHESKPSAKPGSNGENRRNRNNYFVNVFLVDSCRRILPFRWGFQKVKDIVFKRNNKHNNFDINKSKADRTCFAAGIEGNVNMTSTDFNKLSGKDDMGGKFDSFGLCEEPTLVEIDPNNNNNNHHNDDDDIRKYLKSKNLMSDNEASNNSHKNFAYDDELTRNILYRRQKLIQVVKIRKNVLE